MLAVGASGGYVDIFLLSIISVFWHTFRYRLEYCLKGPLSPNQPVLQCYFLISDSEGFQCERCGKVFAYKYYRDKHLKYTRCVDQGDRKYPCHLCSRYEYNYRMTSVILLPMGHREQSALVISKFSRNYC